MKKPGADRNGSMPGFRDCRDAPWHVSTGWAYAIRPYMLFPFAQLLISFVSQFRELLGLGEELLGFGREGLQQAVVTDLAHDEVLELAPVGLFAVQVEAVLTGFVLGRVETPQVPVTALDSLGLFVLGTTHADLDAVVDTRSVADDQ